MIGRSLLNTESRRTGCTSRNRNDWEVMWKVRWCIKRFIKRCIKIRPGIVCLWIRATSFIIYNFCGFQSRNSSLYAAEATNLFISSHLVPDEIKIKYSRWNQSQARRGGCRRRDFTSKRPRRTTAAKSISLRQDHNTRTSSNKRYVYQETDTYRTYQIDTAPEEFTYQQLRRTNSPNPKNSTPSTSTTLPQHRARTGNAQ